MFSQRSNGKRLSFLFVLFVLAGKVFSHYKHFIILPAKQDEQVLIRLSFSASLEARTKHISLSINLLLRDARQRGS